MKPSVIVWDLETLPDLGGFAAANDLVGKSDVEVREAIGEKVPNGENSQNGRLWNIELVISGSVHLGAGEPNHLGPFLGICGDKRAEVSGRACKHRVAEISDPRLHLGIGETRIDLLVELVDD